MKMTKYTKIYTSGYCSYVLTNNNEVYTVGCITTMDNNSKTTQQLTKTNKIKTDMRNNINSNNNFTEYQTAAYEPDRKNHSGYS